MHTVDTKYIACAGEVYSLLCKHPLPSSGGSDAADRHISLRSYQSFSAFWCLKHYCSPSRFCKASKTYSKIYNIKHNEITFANLLALQLYCSVEVPESSQLAW